MNVFYEIAFGLLSQELWQMDAEMADKMGRYWEDWKAGAQEEVKKIDGSVVL